MNDALIGCTGFVGSTLLKQKHFDAQFRSTNIEQIRGSSFDLVVGAGAPAQKWIANAQPEVDREKIEGLIDHLSTVQCDTFVLISTVDVFKNPLGVDENTPVDEDGLHAYGLHRRLLEKFVETRFPNHLIVRLPGLVGPGLRKNVIFDFLNDNNLHTIDSRGSFQFYPMVNLWHDIQTALAAGLKLVHLTAEPITVAEVSQAGFGKPFEQATVAHPASYDFRTVHAGLFGATGPYQYSKRETTQAVRAYAQSEPLKATGEAAGRA
ncbi:pyridine nucleotide transhydrogenase [Paraburkholderia sediminicola]|uniref:Pyridine nucleotide transhydrogenase n=1 Tax=Paraburkholderia rhynchosiae TaxID=487049 RepID=A0ACC7NAT3_9BURK